MTTAPTPDPTPLGWLNILDDFAGMTDDKWTTLNAADAQRSANLLRAFLDDFEKKMEALEAQLTAEQQAHAETKRKAREVMLSVFASVPPHQMSDKTADLVNDFLLETE